MEAEIQYLFDSSGEWIAFKVGQYVFDPSGSWIGWSPWDDSEVVDMNGEYMGHIFYGNRLFRKCHSLYKGFPGFPEYPGYVGYPDPPGYAGYAPLPFGATDVSISENLRCSHA